ncbi:MAG: DUF167 family protein [Alphaproteobacteria bacterium]|nr:DUF167 family protein [Alphaproteobacteria bacterium]
MTGSPVASPVRAVADGITVAVRLTPKARANKIDGVVATESDKSSGALKARVTAAPESGKANAALLQLLARQWKLPKSAMTVATGAKDRRKTVHVAGDPAVLAARLDRWIKENNG